MPGLIWAIPLAALIIVAYLGIQALVHRGETVTVTFRRAAGARAGETKVLYQGVEEGQVIKIVPSEDGLRLDFKLRLTPAAKAGLNSNARFWLIGASPTLSDLSSLRTVFSGVAVGYAPGEGGTPQTHFEGLEKAPVILPGDQGKQYVLNTRTLGSIREGSIVQFHGQPIGKVAEVDFVGEAGFRLEIFVFRPYAALIKPGVRFWRAAPFRASLAGDGFNVNVAPLSVILAGGIDVELPSATSVTLPSKPESQFKLYTSRAAARAGLAGPAVRYDFWFDAPAGNLEEEGAVTLLGFQVGEVESAQLKYDSQGKPYTLVTALLYPQRLNVNSDSLGPGADWRSLTDAKMRNLVHEGYRARLQRTPALVGNQSIALIQTKAATRGDLVYDSDNPRIPSMHGSTDVGDLTSQADQLLAKLNRVPLERIGENVEQVTNRLRELTGSPKMAESVRHLNHTLAELDQILGELEPQVGSLTSKLNDAAAEISATAQAAHQLLGSEGVVQGESVAETLQQLNEAARSIRTLADYLDRHPESIILGKRPRK